MEGVVELEAAREAGVDVLEHFAELDFVAEEEDAAVFAWGGLDFGDEGVDDGGFVDVGFVGGGGMVAAVAGEKLGILLGRRRK